MLNMRTNCLDGFRNLRIVEFAVICNLLLAFFYSGKKKLQEPNLLVLILINFLAVRKLMETHTLRQRLGVCVK